MNIVCVSTGAVVYNTKVAYYLAFVQYFFAFARQTGMTAQTSCLDCKFSLPIFFIHLTKCLCKCRRPVVNVLFSHNGLWSALYIFVFN